ncbi:L-ascorbate oxidase-like [Heracleum sosnowskyi]|uniref:L-ascorbate oxidase-like n=1 Tax=Heracleum sosnowskyi TaxID=360622 RepID=A0AAD8M5U6_9APIA|nr:L-ascorbate oxidase-like [Heracleum sosnowskyi]
MNMFHILVILCNIISVSGESPYRYFHWNVTYGDIFPLGVKQRGILINGQFPGPDLLCVTNDNLLINVHNNLDDPFLLSWNGIQQRRNSYEDGVYGTTCPIPPGNNFTYKMQLKDQIGSFFYFPSLGLHKAAGGYGGIRVLSRPKIPVPYPSPDGDYTLLIGDWYRSDHKRLRSVLDHGRMLHYPDAILINGHRTGSSFTIEQGRTYRLRISNVGLQNSLNLRIVGHKMKLVEVEGTHTVQNTYSSLDIHVGQSLSVLITADQPPRDYYIVVSNLFTEEFLASTAILHYNNSHKPVSGRPSSFHNNSRHVSWSLYQARSIRTNLTASGPRPNPQGSYHYGQIPVNRTIMIINSADQVNGKLRYGINNVSFVPADTPLKLADIFNIPGVFRVGSIPDYQDDQPFHLGTSVMRADFREFVEIVFENHDCVTQSYHLDGYSFFVVGLDTGTWSPASRDKYNLADAIPRCTTQVYPNSWTAIYVALDNVGMWNLRSEIWARRYLGQQFYLRVYTPVMSLRNELSIPDNVLLCGRAVGRNIPPRSPGILQRDEDEDEEQTSQDLKIHP